MSQPADEGSGLPAVKRRRVTAEMEGKYIINMPKGTTPRTRRILAQQAKKGRPHPVGFLTMLLTNTLIQQNNPSNHFLHQLHRIQGHRA